MSAEFQDAMRAAGLEPPEYIEPDKLHRFPGIGKSNGNKAGWCRLFADGIGGVFGDFAADISESWQAKREKPSTASEREAFKRRVEIAKSQAGAEQKTKHRDARERANPIWAEALPAQTHAYLIRKGIQAHGLRLHEGRLVVPLREVDGVLHSLQFIDAEGNKKFLPVGKIAGTFYSIGGAPSDILLICEGMATAHSLYDATRKTVAAAMNCGNLRL